MTDPDYKLQELFVEFDDVYGGSTSYSQENIKNIKML